MLQTKQAKVLSPKHLLQQPKRRSLVKSSPAVSGRSHWPCAPRSLGLAKVSDLTFRVHGFRSKSHSPPKNDFSLAIVEMALLVEKRMPCVFGAERCGFRSAIRPVGHGRNSVLWPYCLEIRFACGSRLLCLLGSWKQGSLWSGSGAQGFLGVLGQGYETLDPWTRFPVFERTTDPNPRCQAPK